MKKRIISGGTSEIAQALVRRWVLDGDDVETTILRPHMPDPNKCIGWNTLVLATGTLHPAAPFVGMGDPGFMRWAESFGPNLFLPLDVLHKLWPMHGDDPCVIFFSGAGHNGKATNRSSYAIAKAALVKMVECLDDEVPECRFVALNPGWVKTRIQDAMPLEPPSPSYWQPIERVASFVAWAAEQPRKVIGGRLIGIHDGWESDEFASRLALYPDAGKMRRSSMPAVEVARKGRRAA